MGSTQPQKGYYWDSYKEQEEESPIIEFIKAEAHQQGGRKRGYCLNKLTKSEWTREFVAFYDGWH